MAAELRVDIGADVSELESGLGRAEQAIDRFVAKTEAIGKLGAKLSALGNRLSMAVTLPIVGLGTAAVKSFADIQALQKGLEAVMGSVEAAGSEFEKLREVSQLPGLGMEEAVKGSINLQAIGISADKSRNILSQFGNAVASVGKGRAEFERAIYGVQQLANTDFPLGEDLNIIKDALPQVSNLLKEAFGTSRSDELAKMGVSSQQVLQVITEGLEKLPRVNGGVAGSFENLQDSIKTSLGRVGAIIDKNLNISGIIDKVSNAIEKLVSWFENLNPAIQTTILAVGGAVAAIGPLLAAVGAFMQFLPVLLQGIGGVSAALTALSGPIGIVTVGLIGIVTAVVANWSKIYPYLQGTIKYFQDLYKESTLFRVAVQTIGFTFQTAFGIVGKVLQNVWENFKAFGKGTLELFAGIGTAIKGALTLNWEDVKAGFARGMSAVANTVIGIGNNAVNTVKDTWAMMNSNADKWMGTKELNISIPKVSAPDLPEKVSSEIIKGASEGASNASQALKNSPIVVDMENAVALKVGTPKLIGKDGKYYNSWWELLAGNDAHRREMDSKINFSAPQIPDPEQFKMLEQQVAISEAVDNINAKASEIFNSGIINTIGGAMEALGDTLVNGGNLAENLGKTLLSTMGGVVKQLGYLAIQTGMGVLAVEKSLKSLNPYVAIAAGAALVAIGSAFSSAAKNIGSSMGGASGGATTSASAGANTYRSSSSYSSGSGYGNSEVVFRISGQDLVGVMERANKRNSRV